MREASAVKLLLGGSRSGMTAPAPATNCVRFQWGYSQAPESPRASWSLPELSRTIQKPLELQGMERFVVIFDQSEKHSPALIENGLVCAKPGQASRVMAGRPASLSAAWRGIRGGMICQHRLLFDFTLHVSIVIITRFIGCQQLCCKFMQSELLQKPKIFFINNTVTRLT